MSAPNPYAAPQAGPPPGRGVIQSPYGYTYVPLGWRTTIATLSVAAVTVAYLALHVLQVSLGDRAKDLHDLPALLLVGLASLVALGALVAGAVFFCIWIHRACANLKGLGRVGMRTTPGWAVGGFFVPFVNLIAPMQAMREIWRASDPKAQQGSWFASASTPLVGVWWGAWLLTGVIDVFAFLVKDDPTSAGQIGLASSATRVVATVAVVILMRGIEARQEEAAALMRAAAATA
jgi:hypothetical protein